VHPAQIASRAPGPDSIPVLGQCWHFVSNFVGPTYFCSSGLCWPSMLAICWPNSSMPTKSTIYQLSANMLTKLTGATVAQWSRWLVKLLPLITVAIHHCSVGSSLSLVIFQNDRAWAWLAMTWERVCQLLTTGWWFSPGTLASSTNKTGHHDVAFVFWTFRNVRLLVK
jgi:hypothetical protein